MDKLATDRFWRHVEVVEPTLCWAWNASKDRYGYGTMKLRGKTVRAHRLSLLINGTDLPDGMVVDHTCRRRDCVNPRHLRITTNAENVLSGTGPTARHALVTHCPQGHPYSGDNLIRRKTGRGCRACQAKYRLPRAEGDAP